MKKNGLRMSVLDAIQGRRSVRSYAGGPTLAAALAREMGEQIAAVEIGAFADGEVRVRITEDVRGADVVCVQPTSPPVNEHLMVLALLADAAKAAGAARVIAVVPYFGYARQDRRDRLGDPRSAQVAGRLLGTVGVNHLISLDLHSPALESALPMPATLFGTQEILLPRIRDWGLVNPIIVSPDAGGVKRAQKYAAALNADLAVVAKERSRPDEVSSLRVLGDVKGRVCLVVDDMASTGRTLAGAADALRKAGARNVSAVFTHAVMAPGAVERIRAAEFLKVMTTDTVPFQAAAGFEVASTAPVLARAVRDILGATVNK